MSLPPHPPFYLLVHPLANPTSKSPANFSHPIIEYHFADDPPSNLLPKSDTESVVILHCEDSDASPIARSLHHNLAVAGVKVTAAPGATAAREGELNKNNNMYIVETLSSSVREGRIGGTSHDDQEDPQSLIAHFRERNALLRRVLGQPTTKPTSSYSEPKPGVPQSEAGLMTAESSA